MLVSRQLSDGDRTYLTRVRAHLRESVGSRAAEEATTYAEILLERGLPVLFDARHLAHVTALNLSVVASMGAAPARHYTTFRIPKRNGGSREISAPRPALKHVQLWIHTALLSALIPHEASHGFAPGRSIVTNASPHVGAELILKLDLRDFFPSISRRQVQGIFRRAGYTVPVARLLTSLTTFGGGLPQGAPTSPALANLVAYGMDARLTRIAQHRRLNYTRYADDLTFSGSNVRRPEVKRLIERAIRDAGFRPNERKARYLHPHHRQAVTGIVVNDKLNWPRNRRRWIRQELYYLEKFGVHDHLAKRGYNRSRYKEFIYGHVYALNMARADEAPEMLERLDAIPWDY